MSSRQLTIIGLLSLLVSSCAYRNLELACLHSGSCRVGGLMDGLQSRNHDVDVLVVHGMGSPPEGYSDRMVGKIGQTLSLERMGSVERIVIDDGDVPERSAVLRRTEFKAANGRFLTFYELTWSPIINELKDAALGYDSASSLERHRSVVNRGLKRELINGRLADPILYLGRSKGRIQRAVQASVCRMMGGSLTEGRCFSLQPANTSREVAIITESLGSKIAFDSLVALQGSEDAATSDAVDSLLRRTTMVYMLANQLPLLALADEANDTGEEAGVAPAGLDGLLDSRRPSHESGTLIPPLEIVAFSDPNDLLSYEIANSYALQFPKELFANVRIGVAGRGFFRIVTDPLRAHTGHAGDDRVVRMLAFGSP